MTPLEDRARFILLRWGERSARDEVGQAFDEGDLDLLEELVRQWRVSERLTPRRMAHCSKLKAAWRRLGERPYWQDVVKESGLKKDVDMSGTQLLRYKREIGASHLPVRRTGRRPKNSRQK
jgi:hypothetical protein